ncbi:MAG: hypothetical protein U0Y08_05655 [Bacteroidia bacterium]
MQTTTDGGYIIGGSSTNTTGFDFDYFIVKLDSIGNVQWQRMIGGSGHDNLNSLSQLPMVGIF